MRKTNIKTLGPRTASLFTGLHDRGQTVFDTKTAATIMDVPRERAAVLLHDAAKRGLVTPIRRGLYNLVPFELGSETFHLANRYQLVHESMAGARYYLSHGSAMDIHQLATQPSFDVYVTSLTRRHEMNLGGTNVHYVYSSTDRFFGMQKIDLGGQWVQVSDVERTLIDGLTLPAYCGGMVEVAKAFVMARNQLDIPRLLDYGRRMKKWAIMRRLGFMLELFELATRQQLDEMRAALPTGYIKLDPDLPSEGSSSGRWGLKLNVSAEELINAVSH